MNTFFANKKLLLVGLALLFFIISMGFLLTKKPSQPSIPQEVELWRNFQPGQTTKDEVVEKLGQPIEEQKANGDTISSFSSQSPTRLHQVVFNNQNTSEIFKQIITDKTKITPTDLIQNYGTTIYILYGPDANSGVYLYVYPNRGVAYLGNNESNTLFEIWYFHPTSLAEFVENWAPGYSENIEDSDQE